MPGISAVGGLTALAIRQEYQVRVASLIKDAVEFEGDMAVKLIASAASAAETGNTLDVLV